MRGATSQTFNNLNKKRTVEQLHNIKKLFLEKTEASSNVTINNKMRSSTYLTYCSDITSKMFWKKCPYTSNTSPSIKGLKSLEKKLHISSFSSCIYRSHKKQTHWFL